MDTLLNTYITAHHRPSPSTRPTTYHAPATSHQPPATSHHHPLPPPPPPNTHKGDPAGKPYGPVQGGGTTVTSGDPNREPAKAIQRGQSRDADKVVRQTMTNNGDPKGMPHMRFKEELIGTQTRGWGDGAP